MTPEDVVSELEDFLESIKQFPNDDTFRCELDRSGVRAILTAIRAAENDALERAALELERGFRIWDDDKTESCKMIRALKHKEAT